MNIEIHGPWEVVMRWLIFSVAAILVAPISASADTIDDLKAQLEAQKQATQQLEIRLQALEAQQANTSSSAPVASSMIQKSNPAEVSASKNEQVTEQKPHVDIYGFIQLDAIYDRNTVNPNWIATLRPSYIPVNCPGDAGCGENGGTNFSARQTRLGFNGFIPTSQGEIKTQFEFDMYGVSGDAGQTTIRLRQAWGEFGQFLAGQTNSLFMDVSVFPNTIDYWGPSGMIFDRDPQVRWTPIRVNGNTLAFALEQPGSVVDYTSAGLSAATQGHNKLPDLTAQYRDDQSWGHYQIAGIIRKLGFDTPGNPDDNPSDSVIGWGVNLSGSINTIGTDRLLAQVAYGHGISNYINDCCVDVATDTSGHIEAVPLLGWLVYYDHYWSEQWASSIGWSESRQSNTTGQQADAFQLGQYASVNLLYYPTKSVMTGAELLYGNRENDNGASGKDSRVQFSAKYNF